MKYLLPLLFAIPLNAQAVADSITMRLGGFIDTYYAFDFNRPPSRDRAFTTQPARHNEFNVNLAYLEGVLSADRLRGRFAVQLGTSVQANYASEPRSGLYSGPDVARYIQEATIGAKLSEQLWLDGGIYLSHIGSESWISRDNLTYSRSFIADFSPYYQSGVKLTWQASPSVVAQVNVVNGWQIISENNGDKAIGGRIDWSINPAATLSVYNFVGNEMPDSVPSQLRVFQGASLRFSGTGKLTVVGTVDLGSQIRDGSSDTWHGWALISRVQLTPTVAVSGRLERYDDSDQVILNTETNRGFRATGGSINVDVTTSRRLLWRTELRGFSGAHRIVPDQSGLVRMNTFLVTSLALTL